MKFFRNLKTAILLFFSIYVNSQVYVIDNTFDIGTGLNPTAQISKIVLQPDGKIIVSGSSFTTFNGVSIASNLIRLNANGTLDTQLANISAEDIIFQSDGKLLIVAGSKVLRLNTNGTIDNTFAMTPSSSVFFQNGFQNSAQLFKVQVDSNDNIYVHGNFIRKYNNITVSDLVKLNPNGTYNSHFTLNYNVNTMEVVNNNKILVFYDATSSSNRFINRFDSNWNIDVTFTTLNNTDADINNIFELNDSSLIISKWNASNTPYLKKMSQNGIFDNTYTSYYGTNPYQIFTGLSEINGNQFIVSEGGTANNVKILESNGTLNTNNNFGTYNSLGIYFTVQPDNKVIFYRTDFNNYNGTAVNKITRLVNSVLNSESITKDSSINFYPNPVNDFLVLDKTLIESSYRIIDINGKLIKQEILKTNQIDFSEIEKGIYIIQINKKNIKIIKN